jgi:chemotaxis protein MotB
VSAGEEETKAQEILIIRRPISGEDAPHKGGVWKIAYADFMTAMMAFFLVMWLINASDKQTLTQVATYFNPLRLTDKVALSKGMHEDDAATQSSVNPEQASDATKDSKAQAHTGAKRPSGKDESHGKAGGAKPRYTEEVLFRDPYGVLSKLAKEATEDHSRPSESGEAYRDPFDPVFRRETRAEKRDVAKETAMPPGGLPPGGQKSAARSTPPAAAEKEPASDTKQASDTRKQAEETQPPPPPAKPAEEGRARKVLEATRQAAEQAAARAVAAKLEADIRAVVARAIAGALPNITVTVTDEGLLISLTDDQNFGMFAIASAEPRPAMVILMEKLGKVIADYPEPLIVRGHTDGRPYKSGTYDNWRLSTARAHMAYYMLVRAGIAEKRFERIEGHADRSLKVPKDPEAAQYRRIEILMR